MSSTKPLNLGSGVTYRPPDTHGYPGGGGVVFSKDPGKLDSRSVSLNYWHTYGICVMNSLLNIYNSINTIVANWQRCPSWHIKLIIIICTSSNTNLIWISWIFDKKFKKEFSFSWNWQICFDWSKFPSVTMCFCSISSYIKIVFASRKRVRPYKFYFWKLKVLRVWNRGCTKKSRQTFYFLLQKSFVLESKVKLKVKTIDHKP